MLGKGEKEILKKLLKKWLLSTLVVALGITCVPVQSFAIQDIEVEPTTMETTLSEYPEIGKQQSGNKSQEIDGLECVPEVAKKLSSGRKTGIIKGMTETSVAPKGNATRAQGAVILKRFMSSFVWAGPPTDQEWVLTFKSKSWVVSEQVPVTCFNSLLFFSLSNAHTALDTVVDTWSVTND